MASSKDKWVRKFFIAEIGRHKDGFTIYKVTSLIFLKKSPETASKVSVWKRYNDFRKLYKSLDTLRKNSSIREPFPPFAKPNFFGRFEKEVVNERRECAIKLLEFIARHSVLYTSDIFVKFFESSLNSDDGAYDCTSSITSCDTSSEDDNNFNNKNINNSMKCERYNGAADIFYSSKDIHSTVPEEHCISTKNQKTEECTKDNSIMLTFNVESLDKDKEFHEKIVNNAITPSDSSLLKTDANDYIIVAAAHINAGHQLKLLGEYEEAYVQYKLGISQLQIGYRIEKDPIQQTKVMKKIQKYIELTDKLDKKYLHCNSSILSKPTIELANYKVLDLIGSVMIVKDINSGIKRAIKTIEKCTDSPQDIFQYILHKKIPFMVNLHTFIETESTIFLIVDYISGGLVWEFIRSRYGTNNSKHNDLFQYHPNAEAYSNQLLNCFEESENNIPVMDQLENIPKGIDWNISTNKLMQQSQKLLKSVDETLKKSNSITHRNKKLISEFNEANKASKNFNSPSMKNDELSKNAVHYRSKNLGISHIPNVYDSQNLTPMTKESSKTNNLKEKKGSSVNNEPSLEFNDDDLNQIYKKSWQVPETISKKWLAQLILVLEALHEQDVIVSNLRPDDLLINRDDNIVLSYVTKRKSNDFTNLEIPYAAPELFLHFPHISPNTNTDIWSLGIIFYELLTGFSFQERHPGLFNSHSNVIIPSSLAENTRSLLKNILRFEPSERLTLKQIKEHPFFENIDWKELSNI